MVIIKQQYNDSKETYTELMPTYQSHPTDTMANTLSLYRQEMDEAAHKVALHIKSDTLSPYYPDSLYTWLANLENYEGDLWLAQEYLASGNPTMAAQVFNGIPSKYALTTAQQSDLNNYAAVAGLIGTTSVYELDAMALTALGTYDNVGGHAEGWVQNILTWYGAHYPVEYVTSSPGGQQLIGNGQIRAQPQALFNYKVTVFPNPAKGEVFLEIALPLANESEWSLYNAVGQRVLSHKMGKGAASETVLLTGVPPGLYFWEMGDGEGRIGCGKLIISK